MAPHKLGAMLRSPILSWRGKWRLLLEPWQPAPAGADAPDYDESVTSFASRRLGWEAAARLVEPLIAGILRGRRSAFKPGGDPTKISGGRKKAWQLDPLRPIRRRRRAPVGRCTIQRIRFAPRGDVPNLRKPWSAACPMEPFTSNRRQNASHGSYPAGASTSKDSDPQSLDGLVLAVAAPQGRGAFGRRRRRPGRETAPDSPRQ